MTTFNCDFPEMSDALMEQLFPQHDTDELDLYLSAESMCAASLYGPPATDSTLVVPPIDSTLVVPPIDSTMHVPIMESTMHVPIMESTMHVPTMKSMYEPLIPDVEPVVTMQSVIDDPLMLLLHFQTLTSGVSDSATTSRVNFERVAFLARKMVKELNKADDTTSVAQFCNVLSHTMSSGVTPNVTSLMHQLEEEQLMLKLQNQHLRLQLQHLQQEEVRRHATTPKRKHQPELQDSGVNKDNGKKQRTLSFTTAQGEVYERLRGTKERKVDLIVRTCVFKFGNAFVTKKQIEQVAMDVGYFSGNTKDLRQPVLTMSKAGRNLNTKSYIKPWGHFFPYWEESASECGEMLLRLSPEFFSSLTLKSSNQ